MWKPAKNPKVEELTKSHRERSINLDCIKPIKIEIDGKSKRYCCWCTEGQLHHGAQRYCSESCKMSATAWAYPQKEEALYILLKKQDNKCNICQYQWSISGDSYWQKMKRLKRNALPERKPEVDHIIPIYKGGTALGLANHQVICFTCHKAKSKVDNSGPRKKEK